MRSRRIYGHRPEHVIAGRGQLPATGRSPARIPAGRWGNADDLKGITVFLASGASDYLNGAVIPVDGGYLGR